MWKKCASFFLCQVGGSTRCEQKLKNYLPFSDLERFQRLLSLPLMKNPSLRAGLLLGIGLMAAVDEIIFHQILGWHHFYDRSTPAIGLLSDGILHAAEVIAIVAGFFLISDLRKAKDLAPRLAWAGVLIGAGGFQLFDGLINHKVLRLHQIRYGVDILPYDIIWNLFAVFLLGVGLAMASGRKRSNA